MTFRRLSLLSKIWLSTSVALTVLFAIAGVVLQRRAVETTAASLQHEVKASFDAYESLWRARAETLASISAVLSSMPNVRAAFSTGDRATIRDTTSEVWSRVSDAIRETAFFGVADPEGRLIAALENRGTSRQPGEWPLVRTIRASFPRQSAGFAVRNDQLYQVIFTPVYVDSVRGPALINVLVAGFAVNHLVAQRLKESTGGSDFVFLSGDRIFASTLNERATAALASQAGKAGGEALISDGVSEYVPLARELIDVEGKPVGSLLIFRSFDSARQHIGAVRRDVIVLWLVAILAGLAVTYVLVRRIVQPVETLDRAAAEVSRQNYSHRVKVESEDELGRLAATFNAMCASLESARDELIRQERISTIGRLASSIVHDLRNPLAAIYGGAEMLVDSDLPPPQNRRLAQNIYRASRRIQELLQDLANVARGKKGAKELCNLRDVICAAVEDSRQSAELQNVRIRIDVAPDLELPLERARVERVFLNLIGNALEMMPGGGEVRIESRREPGSIVVMVEDTGPGISPEIRSQLFQPFVTAGKKNGLGLGLALSRQTLVDHGGEMWIDPAGGRGARFGLRLPFVPGFAAAEMSDRAQHQTTT
jgi:signal transduction histidine kinase